MTNAKTTLNSLLIIGAFVFLGCTKNSSSNSTATPPQEFLSLEVCAPVLTNQSCTLDEFYIYSLESEKKEAEIKKSWKQDKNMWVLSFDIIKPNSDKVTMKVWYAKEDSNGKNFAKAKRVLIPGMQESQQFLIDSMISYYQPVANKVKRSYNN
jgi:hypothetical protein